MDTTIINIIQPDESVNINVEDSLSAVLVNVSQVGQVGPQGPPGASGSLGNFLFGEILVGVVNGSNATFTTPFNFVPGKIEVFINGLLQKLITHYQTIGVNTIIFNDSPQTGDTILSNFIKQ